MQPTQLDPQVVNLAKAIRQTESGGDFSVKGKSGEYGAYQFTPNTWNSQASKYGINTTLDKATPEQQNAVAYNQIKEWKDAGHNVAQIASMWNAGQGEPNAYTGTFSNGKPSTGVNSYGVKYSVPDYAYSVANAYQTLKNGGQVNADPNNPSSTSNVSQVTEQPKNFPQKVGDFFTGGTQQFGQTIGQSLAAPANADLYDKALQSHTQNVNDLQDAIRKIQINGGDPSHLIGVLQQEQQNAPKLEDFTGQVINKSAEQVLGEGAMAGLEALSGGILEGGVKSVASKTLGTGGKLLEGAKLGATYGAIGGGANAMQNDASLGGVVGGAVSGGALGGVLGAGLSGAGVLGGKLATSIEKTGSKLLPQTEERLAKQTEWLKTAEDNVAKEAERSLPLTPSQKMKEAQTLARTGSNLYTTLADTAKYGVQVGSEDAIAKLQHISDQFENAINHAQANEHSLFNVTELRNNAYKSINENLTSSTERASAKAKLDDEINSILQEKGTNPITTQNGQTLVKSDVMERLRRTGNDWGQYNKLNPDSVKNGVGRALGNAVRDQVEKNGSFPAYRQANREWGKIIHAQEMLQKIEDSGKPLKELKGLFQPLYRRFISGAIGLHSGGIGHLILSELGSEYAAKIFSNPSLRTYFDNKIIQRFGNGKATPKAIMELENEIRSHLDQQVKNASFKALPPGSPQPIQMPMAEPRVQAPLAQKVISQNSNTGQMQKTFTSGVGETQYAVIDTNKLMTKSQLTDRYNKVVGKKK